VWFAANSTVLTYNAALNRPAYESSVYVNSIGRWTANLANDGSRESNGEKDNEAQCWGSEFETNPWWAVDLGRPTTIYRVDFTNRGDNAGTYCTIITSAEGGYGFGSVCLSVYLSVCLSVG